ncbi:MAG: Bax inhibitor-1/YccA family protein [Clostridia bacterium]|nr:Bax inhibitor-1/YccA family protein [Clostridia bacterium]
MNNNYNNDDFSSDWNAPNTTINYDRETQPFYSDTFESSKDSILSRVFLWMTAGLGLSAIAALTSFKIFGMALFTAPVFYGLIIAELVLVLVFSRKITTLSATAAKLIFIAYSVINGITLSCIFFVYEIGSIYITFFITSSMFAVAAIYGKVTKQDLSGIGTYLVMGLWGLIIAGTINMILHSSGLEFFTSFIGVIIFVGLTAYDVNRLKDLAVQGGNEESVQKIAIWGALQLYLDFINLFLRLLRFFGKRRR